MMQTDAGIKNTLADQIVEHAEGNLLTLFRIRPLGVESKKDMGARKMQKCILLKSIVAVLYPTVTRSVDLARMQKELPTAKAT